MIILKEHNKRLATALIMLFLLIVALYFHSWPLFFLLLAAALAAQYEFYNLFWGKKNAMLPEKIAGLALGAALLSTTFLHHNDYASLAFFSVAACTGGAISFLVRFGSGHDDASLSRSMLLLAGFAYIPLVLQLAFTLSSGELLIIILAVCGSDAAAYYVGSTWGKRKIWPRISPKKSWLGSFAGLFSATLIVLVAGHFLLQAELWRLAIAGIILNVMSQLGDFFESALKRSNNVKDSGTILPGHGGVLDRIDSLLFALPTYALFKTIALL